MATGRPWAGEGAAGRAAFSHIWDSIRSRRTDAFICEKMEH